MHRAVTSGHGRYGAYYNTDGYRVSTRADGSMSWNPLDDEMRMARRQMGMKSWDFNPGVWGVRSGAKARGADHRPEQFRHQHGHKGRMKSVQQDRDTGASPTRIDVHETMRRNMK